MYQYQKKSSFMTDAEKNFYAVLQLIVGNKYEIFAQVHLPTILEHKVRGQNWKGAFGHINQKSVDFVLCLKETLEPILAIELNDKSHDKEDRMTRDGVVQTIFEKAGISLIFIKNQTNYSSEEVEKQIFGELPQQNKEIRNVIS